MLVKFHKNGHVCPSFLFIKTHCVSTWEMRRSLLTSVSLHLSALLKSSGDIRFLLACFMNWALAWKQNKVLCTIGLKQSTVDEKNKLSDENANTSVSARKLAPYIFWKWCAYKVLHNEFPVSCYKFLRRDKVTFNNY